MVGVRYRSLSVGGMWEFLQVRYNRKVNCFGSFQVYTALRRGSCRWQGQMIKASGVSAESVVQIEVPDAIPVIKTRRLMMFGGYGTRYFEEEMEYQLKKCFSSPINHKDNRPQTRIKVCLRTLFAAVAADCVLA